MDIRIEYEKRSIEFYRNIYRDFFNLEDDMEFLPGTPEDDRRRGIDIAIEQMKLSDTEKAIIILRYERKATIKDIAASVVVSESKVSSTINSFKTQIKLSPYRMYIKGGDQAGERYTYYVRNLFNHKKNEEYEATYENFGEQIGWLDTTILGLFGVSSKLIRSLLEAGWFQIEFVLDAIKQNSENWVLIKGKNKKDAAALENILKDYRLLA